MSIIMPVLYFLLFVVFISILIVIHELGHLAMAKAFNVYCLEFSVGMGPAIFSRKRKNGETKVSFRAIPFGGYVSMLDDDVQLPEGVQVDRSRSLSGIKKWKKAIIMVAGVVMNLILALIIFFIAAWVPQQKFAPNAFTVDSATATALSLNEGNFMFDTKEIAGGVYSVDENATVYYKDSSTQSGITAALNYNDFTFKKTKISDYLDFYKPYTQTDDEGNVYTVISKENVIDISKVDYVEVTFTNIYLNENDEEMKKPVPLTIHQHYDSDKDQYFYEDTGLKVYTLTLKCSGIGQATKQTFSDFGNAATIVVTSLQTLLTKPSSWNQAGGIIAVGFSTSQALENYGWNYFLYYWGVISVNLAILNILPFPGLDGWHLLVLAIEGITRKPIPSNVKNIVALIGLALLFGLMIILLFKDVFTYIFAVGTLLV